MKLNAVYLNSMWMVSEKIISIVGLIFVTSYVAKYVGSGVFGQIALATSIFQIIQVASQLGCDILVFKRTARRVGSGIKLIILTESLRGGVYILLSLPLLYFQYVRADGYFIFVLACMLSCFFASLDVYSIYYNALLRSKVNVMINAISLIFCLAIRWLIVYLKMDVIYLAVPIVLTGLLPFLVRRIFFYNYSNIPSLVCRKKSVYRKFILFAGFPFFVSALAVALYSKISILVLGYLYGDSVVGVYSVAVSLSTCWMFICTSVITSFLPSIYNENNMCILHTISAKLHLIVVFLSAPIIIGVIFLGRYFIGFLYGEEYVLAYIPLVILSFATLMSALGTVSARIIAKFSGYSYLSKKMLLVLILSFPLSYLFISLDGATGAAFATLLTEVMSLTVFNYFYKKALILKIHVKMFNINNFRKTHG